MVVSLGKNISIKDTDDSFIRVINSNFEETYNYVNTSLKHSLPSTYQQVEWIGFNGQYIDTGFKANTTTTSYETKIEHTTISTQGLFGSRNVAGTISSSSCNIFLINGAYRLDWVTGSTSLSTDTISANTPYTISITRGKATINGTEYTYSDSTSLDELYNFYIGEFSNGSTATYGSPFVGKLYYSKLYSNGSLVRNYVPCYRKSDSVIGLYDLVNGEFYTNAGSGTFTKGDDVESPLYLYDLLTSLSTFRTFTYSNLPSGATFTWYYNGKTSTDSSITLIEGTSLSYKLTYSDGSMCCVSDVDTTKDIVIDCNSLQVNTKKLTISPTPSDATVTINVAGNNPFGFVQSGNSIVASEGTKVNITISKYGYTTYTNNDYEITTDETLPVTLAVKLYTYTINPTPSSATVVLTCGGYTQSGNSITVQEGKTVTWNVSSSGYVTQSGSKVVTSNITDSIALVPYVTLTISPTPSDATVTLAASGYTQSGNTITVPSGTNVVWMVEKTDYVTQNGTYNVTSNYTMNVTLEEAGIKLTIVTVPADASVRMRDVNNSTADLSEWTYTNTDDDYELQTLSTTNTDIVVPSIYTVTKSYRLDGESGTIEYIVEKEGYDTVVGTETITEKKTITVTLTQQTRTLTVIPTPTDATVTMSYGSTTVTGKTVTVPYGTTVTVTVSKDHYVTETREVVVKTDMSIAVGLVLCKYTLTINTTPSDAIVEYMIDGKIVNTSMTDWTIKNYDFNGNVELQDYIGTSTDVTMPTTYTTTNTITADYGTVITYKVYKYGYSTVENTITLESDTTLEYTLTKVYKAVNVDGYTYTMDTDLYLTQYTGTDTDVVVPTIEWRE